MEAAEAVCGFDGIEDFEVLDLLTSLADKSLVSIAVDETGEEGSAVPCSEARYRMLETIYQYALERQQIEHHHRPVGPTAPQPPKG